MSDVARLAGVSAQTVSRTLSGAGPVAARTRERVLAAVEELGYKPDLSAQTLATGRSRTVGVLMTGNLSYGRIRSYIAVERRERERGNFVVSATADADDTDSLLAALKHLQSVHIKALAILGQRADAVSFLVPYLDQPTVVALNDPVPGGHFSRVEVDQHAGVRDLVDHMCERGCRRLVLVVPAGVDVDARARQRAFESLCLERGIGYEVVTSAGWGCEDGAAVAGEVGARSPEGVLAGNDHLACGLAYGLAERGLKVGRDYALSGFDDTEFGAFMQPALTSVSQDMGRLAEAISIELDRVAAGGEPRHTVLPARLVVRASTTGFQAG